MVDKRAKLKLLLSKLKDLDTVDSINNKVTNNTNCSQMLNTLKTIYKVPDFVMLIVGSIGAGKSICVGSIIKYNQIAKKYTDIIVFSGSVENGFF